MTMSLFFQGLRFLTLTREPPDDTPFGYSGLAFYLGKLYASTNVGLLEVEDGRVSHIYRVQKEHSVVSGPWLDPADRLLWMMDDQTFQMMHFDGSTWVRVKMPIPNKGYYSRSDIGVVPTGNSNGFWLAAGGSVWRWNPSKNSWDPVSQPSHATTAKEFGELIGVLPLPGKVLFIMRRQSLPFLLKAGERFDSDIVVVDDDGWRPISMDGNSAFLAEKWVVAGNSGYFCAKDGSLFEVTIQKIQKLAAPGDCEAIAEDESGALITSFRQLGVYKYDHRWISLISHPYASGQGDYRAYLTVSGSKLAYVVSANPVLLKPPSSGTNFTFGRNAPTQLWFSTGEKWQSFQVQ